jgi:hypothetical protein
MPQQVCQRGSRVSAAEVLEATAIYHVDCRLIWRAAEYQRCSAQLAKLRH